MDALLAGPSAVHANPATVLCETPAFGLVADVGYNVKSGADEFFYVRDVTDEVQRSMTPEQVKSAWGVPRGQLGALGSSQQDLASAP